MLFERKEKTQIGMSHLRCGEEEEFQITLNMFHPQNLSSEVVLASQVKLVLGELTNLESFTSSL